jgi:Kef-type K+ transport system membrane component KefB
MLGPLTSLLAVMVVVAPAPIVVALVPGSIPQGGVLIGPEVLGVGNPGDVELVASLGLGFLFLLAGYELDPSVLRERAGGSRSPDAV